MPRKITPAGKPGAYKSFGLEFLELLREQGGLRSDHTVLEIGCGIGRCAAPLTKFLDADSKYYGVDVVREVVGYCTDHITARYPNFHFRHINVENAMYNPSAEVSPRATSLPLKSNTVDTVFLWSVFTHMKPSDIASYLCDICRVLRPGGRLLASYFLMTEGRLKDGCKIGVVSFDHEMDGFWTRRPDQPEQALAVFEPFIIEAYNIAGLSLEKVVYCEPSNPKTIAKQDVIVASKK